jgi:hypothetical protein
MVWRLLRQGGIIVMASLPFPNRIIGRIPSRSLRRILKRNHPKVLKCALMTKANRNPNDPKVHHSSSKSKVTKSHK